MSHLPRPQPSRRPSEPSRRPQEYPLHRPPLKKGRVQTPGRQLWGGRVGGLRSQAPGFLRFTVQRELRDYRDSTENFTALKGPCNVSQTRGFSLSPVFKYHSYNNHLSVCRWDAVQATCTSLGAARIFSLASAHQTPSTQAATLLPSWMFFLS